MSSCCHFVSLTALIAPCRTALLPASCWHLCWRSAGVIAHVALGSTSLLCWRCHPCCIIAVIVLAFLLPSLHPCCCQHHVGVFAGITLALLPSLHSCTLPLLRWCCHQHCLRFLLRCCLLLPPSLASHPAGCCLTSPHATTFHLRTAPLLLSCHRLLVCRSCTSCPAGCRVTSHHAATSHLSTPPPLAASITLLGYPPPRMAPVHQETLEAQHGQQRWQLVRGQPDPGNPPGASAAALPLLAILSKCTGHGSLVACSANITDSYGLGTSPTKDILIQFAISLMVHNPNQLYRDDAAWNRSGGEGPPPPCWARRRLEGLKTKTKTAVLPSCHCTV